MMISRVCLDQFLANLGGSQRELNVVAHIIELICLNRDEFWPNSK